MRGNEMSSGWIRRLSAALLAVSLTFCPAIAQEGAQAPPSRSSAGQRLYTFQAVSDLVLVNVVARDKHGSLVHDLKASDFTVLEDGKPQRIASFDVEQVEVTEAGPSQASATVTPVSANVLTSNGPAGDLSDRRLIVVFFDFGSMEPDEAQHAIDTAQNYVDKRMTPADLLAVVSYDTSLQVLQDFTNDRTTLSKALRNLSASEGEGLAQGTTGDTDTVSENGAGFTPDETEYNLFNTDMKLQAIASLAQSLGKLQQKKSILYFSSGMSKTGIDNQTQLRAAINTAVRANVSLYPVDIRGLEALPPGGDATTGSLRGTAAYSGAAVQNQLNQNFASQETLVTLASDTGGKAFLDSNDFGRAFSRVQADTSSYYVLGYRSSNHAMDGRYRHIAVKVNRPDIKLEHRAGYYGPRDFVHFTKEDREQQLEEEMASELPNTDLQLYLDTGFFRLDQEKYFVAVSLVVPGSAVPFKAADKDKASLDLVGLVRDAKSRMPVGNVRDSIKVGASAIPQMRQRNIQYDTGFLLPPGTYHLKLVVRENLNGRIGAFETDFVVPDLKKAPLKMSSVVLASQRGAKPKAPSPLPVVPNIAHVFAGDQPLYLYYEVYDPAKKPSVRVLTNIQFFRGKLKAYETPLVEAKELNQPQRKAATFEIEVPTAQLRPGWYTCQINVIDDAGGTFAFPRLPLVVRAAAPTESAK
jgi:VWFA-related protein